MTQATDEAGREDWRTRRRRRCRMQLRRRRRRRRSCASRVGRLRDQFDQRSNQAGSQVRSLAEALRRSGNDLSNEGNSNAARLTGQAAERIERLGSYLEQKSGDELMRDVETFARGRPWMLAGHRDAGWRGRGAVHEGVVGAALRRLPAQSRKQWPTRPDGYADGGAGVAGAAVAGEPAKTSAPMPGRASVMIALARDPYAGTR